jgi:hypothetical protein
MLQSAMGVTTELGRVEADEADSLPRTVIMAIGHVHVRRGRPDLHNHRTLKTMAALPHESVSLALPKDAFSLATALV